MSGFNISNMFQNSISTTSICREIQQLIETLAINSRYASSSENYLRNKINELKDPWYQKLFNYYIIGTAMIGLVMLKAIIMKCNVIALTCSIILDCFPQCCQLGSKVSKLTNNDSSTLQSIANDLDMNVSNRAQHPESDSGIDILLDTTQSDNNRRPITKHMLGKKYN